MCARPERRRRRQLIKHTYLLEMHTNELIYFFSFNQMHFMKLDNFKTFYLNLCFFIIILTLTSYFYFSNFFLTAVLSSNFGFLNDTIIYWEKISLANLKVEKVPSNQWRCVIYLLIRRKMPIHKKKEISKIPVNNVCHLF